MFKLIIFVYVLIFRGHEHDLDKVVDFMRNTLKWRDDNKIDTVVRHDILHKVNIYVDF
jgi:hypothetical protein